MPWENSDNYGNGYQLSTRLPAVYPGTEIILYQQPHITLPMQQRKTF